MLYLKNIYSNCFVRNIKFQVIHLACAPGSAAGSNFEFVANLKCYYAKSVVLAY